MKSREEHSRREKERVRRKKIHAREMLGKSQNIAFFQWFVGRYSGRCGAMWPKKKWKIARRCILKSKVGMWKNGTLLWREAHFQVKIHKTSSSDHFWMLGCGKMERRCGAKHASQNVQSTPCSDHFFLEVRVSKNCTPLWHESRVQVSMWKTWGVRATFEGADVQNLAKCRKHLHFGALLKVWMSKKRPTDETDRSIVSQVVVN